MSKSILELRELLAKTATVFRTASELAPAKMPSVWPTGWSKMDQLLEGGLPSGALTELIVSPKGSGGASVIRRLLEQCSQTSRGMALIDALDSFDPSSCGNELISRLLWVRCANPEQALKAADLLLRDGNVPLVLLDFGMNTPAQLRKVSSTVWYRFQRVLEKTTVALLVLTPSAMVSSAQYRLSLRGKFSVKALAQTPEQLLEELEINLIRGEVQSDFSEKFA